MQWHLEYSANIWPMLGSAAFMWALAAYTWRHRSAPGAIPLSSGMFLVGLWALFAAFEISSADLPSKLFWFRLKNVVTQPAAVAGFCFAFEYSGLGGWITRRNLALLLVPSAAIVPMMFLDDSRMLWTQYWVGGTIHRTLSPMGVAMNAYGVGQLALGTAAIASLFFRSPLHRTPAGLMMLGQLGMVVAMPLETLNVFPDTPLDLSVLSADFMFAMYTIALYRFRIFDVVPVARQTVLERMVDGMLVLDAQGHIVDLNPAAQELLGTSRSRALGQDGASLLAVFPELSGLALDHGPDQADAQLGASEARWYQVSASPLADQRGFRLGRLITFRDITENKRAQAMLMEQQRALAALEERERVARELHDGLGQVLGFVKMQAQAAQGLVGRDPKTAEGYLGQLAAVAQDAHADVREFILGTRRVHDATPGFLAPLRHYLDRFSATYGLSVELSVPPELSDNAFGPAVRVQLLRIIQEALTNARKHAHASHAQVGFVVDGGEVAVTIADDGQGFDPAQIAGGDQKYGLRFMRDRAEEVGGTLEVQSAPGQSTRVVVRVPGQGVPSVPSSNPRLVSTPQE